MKTAPLYLCTTCHEPLYEKDMLRQPLNFAHPEGSAYFWMRRIKRLFDKAPLLQLLQRAAFPVLLVATLFLSLLDNTRDYTAVPLTLFAISWTLSECLPLSLVPRRLQNAVTDQGNSYKGAAHAAGLTVLCIVVLGLLAELVNQYIHMPAIGYSTLTTRSKRCTKRLLSSMLFAAPLVYCAYLVVSTQYTSSRSVIIPSPANDLLVAEHVNALPNDVPGAKQMKMVWKKRKFY